MYKIFGAQTRKIWEGKTAKIWRDFTQLLSLTAKILDTNWDIKNREQTWSSVIHGGFSKKKLWTLVHNEKIMGVDVDLP